MRDDKNRIAVGRAIQSDLNKRRSEVGAEELKPCQDRMRFRKKVAAPPEPEYLKPELLSCPFCGTICTVTLWGGEWEVRCQNDDCPVEVSLGRNRKIEAIAAWNTRPVSELERLAREVLRCRASDQHDGGKLQRLAIEALDAYFTDPSQKGTQDE